MHEIILCKLGEVVLKGLNRRSFEMKLMGNIRRRTPARQVPGLLPAVHHLCGACGGTCDLTGAYAACKKVFGIIAVARALPCAKEKEAISPPPRRIWAALSAARVSRWKASGRISPSPWAPSS